MLRKMFLPGKMFSISYLFLFLFYLVNKCIIIVVEVSELHQSTKSI